MTASETIGYNTARVRVGKVAIDPVDLEGALTAIEDLIRAGRGGTVFTPNVDHVVLADENPRFCRAYQEVSLSLADGMPVLWALTAVAAG